MRYFLLALFAMTSTLNVFSQCEEGEIEVMINLYTDAWGYELYWELLPSGQACGDNPILFGGNSIDVGCDGVGQQDAQGGNGYDSNTVISLDPICLVEGEFYDLIFVDDWNDGGLTFEIFEDGAFTHAFTGAGSPSIFTFEVGNVGLADHDSPCDAAPIDIDGDMWGVGTTSIANNGLFFKTEAGAVQYDQFRITGVGGSANAVVEGNPLVGYGHLAIGYKF